MKKHLLFALLLLFAATMQAQDPVNKPDTHTLKILYLFETDLTQAFDSFVDEFEEGQKYSVGSPALEGYRPVPDTVRGKMPEYDVIDTVLYLAETYTVTTMSEPEEGGNTSGGGTYGYNEEVTVTAEANQGFQFVKWAEEGVQVSDNASYTFTVTGDRILKAVFEAQSVETHTVTISPLIAHGAISVSPSGQVEVGTTVTITATPDEGYVLERLLVYNKDDVSQTVELDDQTFIMPAFDVMVSATFDLVGSLPVINEDITAPAPICAGDVLDLTAPSVSDATSQAWQMSADGSFALIVAYEGQPLEASFDGWKIRFVASNAHGEVYSNVVSITVKDISDMVLSGDLNSCTGLACTYTVAHASDAALTWQVTDDKAVIDPSGRSLTVLWGTQGAQKVSVLAEDLESGCSVELSLDVTVQSYIDDSDVHDIVAKKHDGKDYLLIYPNPKDTYKYQWYKDGRAITGANGQYYYPAEGLADGDYQVYISFNADSNGNLFCGAFSAVYTVGAKKAACNIYPNPAQMGEGLVVVNEGDEAELFVYSLDGKLIHRQVVANGRQSISVELPQGIYLVRINANESLTTERIVIQ